MNDKELQKLIDGVKDGHVSRRSFLQSMLAVGIAAPIASQMLAWKRRRHGAAGAGLQADEGRWRRTR